MVYRTMQGREIDLDKIIRANELTPAVGNMQVNARGDQLGPAGQIVKKREEVVAEYYEATKPKKRQEPVDSTTPPTVKKIKSGKSTEDKE